MSAADNLKTLLWTIAGHVEFQAGRLRGKGYDTPLVHEVALTSSMLTQTPRLALDIGGNIGDYTAGLLARYPDLEVHVFEPSAVNIEKLQTRFAGQDSVTVVPFAASATAGEALLFANAAGSGLGSLTKRKLDHFNIPFEHQETIASIRVDDYWTQTLPGRDIDIVKIDVEGHELDVLNSFGDVIRRAKVVQFEFGGACIDTRTYVQDLWYFFKDAGFDIYRISPLGLCPLKTYSERDEHFLYCNFVAVRR